ncbi:hypothetical protein V5R22_23365 [Bacillus thuringiensis]|uniref:Uncharacterized protein n=1 Tax=Bacillus cereus VD133 TaxID=1053233 RepID=A0A9W5PV99_BACCE|nr:MULTISPECIES: hypothetical protein [Bacillus]EJQ22447.1 hypothetical protein IE5_01450 [Bacillus cereus BAG3X2-2]EOO38004.1 hypothetical protein IIU_01091 [Bacillus cereus VD133]ETE87562.1 hypothetical protein C621_0232605 [Bacillus thuringiensis serovar aizawai str. Leapi01]ETE99281.1 hypothetical protein C623_0205780 [Bacillus thuringiensis serovar aizawai str. Hu4-2]KLA36879.1 hypothetical protein B4158_1588 [Bacillus cereus]
MKRSPSKKQFKFGSASSGFSGTKVTMFSLLVTVTVIGGSVADLKL